MVDINLLPIRDKYKAALQCVMVGLVVIIVILSFVIWNNARHHKQQSHLQTLRVASMQHDIDQLRVVKPLIPVKVDMPKSMELMSPVLRCRRPLLHTKMVTIHYAKAIDLAVMFRDKSNGLLSKHGKVTVDPRTNLLWFEETTKQLEKIMVFLKQLDIPAQQIVIEARLVNMNQESARDLGIKLGLISAHSPGTNNPMDFAMPGGRLGLNLAATPLEATAATLGFSEARLISQRLLDTELSALESAGRAKVIASPRLVTSNQIPALIESGEDIPYQEFGANGTTSVSFKKAVLRLKVVPYITGPNELMMSLVINQDSDSGKRVQGVPIIATKAIETHILLHNGQTIVLGGIYQEDKNHQTDQVPVLGDIPVMGHLFKRKQMRTRHESLLIFITPKIIT